MLIASKGTCYIPRMDTNWEERFIGISKLYGTDGAESIAKAHVCVIGLGGVGSWAVESLARSGVGKITLIEPDSICVSNSNRQIHAGSESYGKQKAGVMTDRILSINPECRVTVHDLFLTKKNIPHLIPRDCDVIIDAIDSSSAKAALIAYCRKEQLSLLVCGGAGARIDPTRIRVTDLNRSINDTLLRSVRRKLKQEYGFPKYPKKKFHVNCIFSDEHPIFPEESGDCSISENPGPTSLNCQNGYGSICHITAIFGFYAASECLKMITRSNRQTAPLHEEGTLSPTSRA